MSGLKPIAPGGIKTTGLKARVNQEAPSAKLIKIFRYSAIASQGITSLIPQTLHRVPSGRIISLQTYR